MKLNLLQQRKIQEYQKLDPQTRSDLVNVMRVLNTMRVSEDKERKTNYNYYRQVGYDKLVVIDNFLKQANKEVKRKYVMAEMWWRLQRLNKKNIIHWHVSSSGLISFFAINNKWAQTANLAIEAGI